MKGRHELKHHINASDYAQLRARLQAVTMLDQNAGDDGGYVVRSLYFDNYSDKAVVEKLSGLSRREKFRLRYYNDDTSFIRLERKSKANRLCYKETAAINLEHCTALLKGEFECLKNPVAPLFMELYTKIRYQNLRPTSILEYHREAYNYRAGNVRVTFDSNIRSTNNVTSFLDQHMSTIPVANTIILEIKYDGFLPGIIQDILQIGWCNQTEFSKYVVGRLAN